MNNASRVLQNVCSNNESTKNKYRITLYKITLFAAIYLTLIQQMPLIRDQFYEEIRFVLYFIFGVLSFIALVKFPITIYPKLIKLFVFTIITITLELLLFELLELNFPLDDYTDLFITLGILVISYTTKLNRKELSFLINSYAFLAIIMGVVLILYYGGGFTLREQYIKGVSKNQTGPIISIAIVFLIFQLFNSKNYKHIYKFFYFLSFLILGLSTLVILRNRAGLLAFGVVFLIYLFFKMRRKIYLKKLLVITSVILVIIILIFVGLLDPLIYVIIDSFTLNYNAKDLDSLSAGRISIYLNSADFISDYPLLGEIKSNDLFYAIPHNYILDKWVKYGIIGSMPFVMLYMYIWNFAIRKLLYQRKVKSDNSNPALWLLLLGLIISIFEYTYPYGPGVSQIMVWFCLGNILPSEHHRQLG